MRMPLIARILFMAAGSWVTVGIFAIQILIWIFSDNDLQVWCDNCAFGKKRNEEWTAKKQSKQLEEALKSVGV